MNKKNIVIVHGHAIDLEEVVYMSPIEGDGFYGGASEEWAKGRTHTAFFFQIHFKTNNMSFIEIKVDGDEIFGDKWAENLDKYQERLEIMRDGLIELRQLAIESWRSPVYFDNKGWEVPITQIKLEFRYFEK